MITKWDIKKNLQDFLKVYIRELTIADGHDYSDYSIGDWQKFCQKNPDNMLGWTIMGIYYYDHHKDSRAKKCWARSIGLCPKNFFPYFLSHIMIEKSNSLFRKRREISMWKEYQKNNPKDVLGYLWLITLYLNKGDKESANLFLKMMIRRTRAFSPIKIMSSGEGIEKIVVALLIGSVEKHFEILLNSKKMFNKRKRDLTSWPQKVKMFKDIKFCDIKL